MSRLPLVFWRETGEKESSLLLPPALPANRGSAIRGPSLSSLGFDPGALVKRELHDAGDARAGVVEIVGDDPFFGRRKGSARLLPPENHLSVREQGGKIGRLYCRNGASAPVFLPASVVLRGGAQNRMPLQDEIIEPGERELRVFCVEQGRWEESNRFFRGQSRFADLPRMRLLLEEEEELGENRMESSSLLQSVVWDLVLESLLRTGALNETLDVSALEDENAGEGGDAGVRSERKARREISARDAQGARARYTADSRTGLFAFQAYPNESFASRIADDLIHELEYRSRFRRYAGAAREYFRVFDKEKYLAVRCLEDGRPLRDRNGGFLLFRYENKDLAHSFRPPLESPPPENPVREGVSEKRRLNLEEFAAILGECEVQGGMRAPRGERIIRLRHPGENCVARAVFYEEELASLEAYALP